MPRQPSSSMTVKVSKDIKKFIQARTSAGNYESAGAFVEECVREFLAREEKATLEQLLLEGLQSPKIAMTSTLKQRMLKEFDERSKARRTNGRKPSGRGAA